VAFIKKFTQRGEIVINFTEDLITVPDLDFINKGTVVVDGEVVPVLHLEINAAENSNPRKRISEWKVISQTPRQLQIQVKFEETIFLSTEGDDDLLRITINDPFLFTS